MGQPERTAAATPTPISGGAPWHSTAASGLARAEDSRRPCLLCERQYERNEMGRATRFQAHTSHVALHHEFMNARP